MAFFPELMKKNRFFLVNNAKHTIFAPSLIKKFFYGKSIAFDYAMTFWL
jgi:hypothetical protein